MSVKIWKTSQNDSKNFPIEIPNSAVTLLTGAFGSGKSSWAAALLSEGHSKLRPLLPLVERGGLLFRRSSLTRGAIQQLSPCLTIPQLKRSDAARSWADYIGLNTVLARFLENLGRTYCLLCGNDRQASSERYGQVLSQVTSGRTIALLAEYDLSEREDLPDTLLRQGVSRYKMLNKLAPLEELKAENSLSVMFDTFQSEDEARLKRAVQRAKQLNPLRVFLAAVNPTTLEISDEYDLPLPSCSSCREALEKYPISSFSFIADDNPLRYHIDGKVVPAAQFGRWTVEQLGTFLQSISCTSCNDLIDYCESLRQIGLNYLPMDRFLSELSSGELGRVRLFTRACLPHTLCVVDEAGRSVHPGDLDQLDALFGMGRSRSSAFLLCGQQSWLRKLADWQIQLGGASEAVLTSCSQAPSAPASIKSSATAPKAFSQYFELCGAKTKNLSNLDLRLPRNCLIGICGVSGSGKSALVFEDLLNSLRTSDEVQNKNLIVRYAESQFVSETKHSPLCVHVGLLNAIAGVLAQTTRALSLGLSEASFRLSGKKSMRCEDCRGRGYVLRDLQLGTCTGCNGRRYKPDLESVRFRELSMADFFLLRFGECLPLLANIPDCAPILRAMHQAGLDHLKLGDELLSLSQGERQLIEFAKVLVSKGERPSCILLDEPCSELSGAEVDHLLLTCRRLTEEEASLIVIEHNLEFLLQCDHLVELGPAAGPSGGKIIFEGRPEILYRTGQTATAQALREWVDLETVIKPG